MASGSVRSEIAGHRSRLLPALVLFMVATATAWAQTTAIMVGTVKDTSGAVVPGVVVTVKHIQIGLTRSVQTDQAGNYRLPALPVGQYEVIAESSGFKMTVRRGITLVVAQEAVVDLTLEVGSVEQQVTVTAEAPLVNTTLSSTKGLVGERQVKDLPLNGRSFDQLLTLNAGTTDYSSNAGRNSFSVSGRRPDENLFTINGVELMGADSSGQYGVPYGSSGQLLGVDAVREFNVQTETFGAEQGKKAGGQVGIVTESGTNQLHGSAFHYLRNNVLDARNFFDDTTPPFKRNQFGGTLGGPLKRDKLFLFGSYEGFRQRRGGSGQAVVPNLDARRGFLPVGPNNSLIQVPNLQPRMLGYIAFWREPNGPELGGGAAIVVSNPVEAIREDLGLLRMDYTISDKDALSATFLRDDGNTISPNSATQFTGNQDLRMGLVGVQETRVFTPALLNVATFGFSRGYAASATVLPVDFPKNLYMVEGKTVPGQIRIGGSIVGGATTIASAGGSPPAAVQKTGYTVSDDVHYTRSNHSLTFGAWVQRYHDDNWRGHSTEGGVVVYSTLLTMLQDQPTNFQGAPVRTPSFYRMTHAAFYLQDEIKLRRNLSLRLGLRDEMTSGWNEANCHASNYFYDQNGDMLPEPHVGCSALQENKNKALLTPRVGLAWDPTGTAKWSVRAGFGMYNSIQNIFAWRLNNPPFNGLVFISNTPLLSFIPLPAGTQAAPSCTAERVAARETCQIYTPNGVEPSFKMPTVSEWNFSIERELAKDLMLRVGYTGSQGYHGMTNIDPNTVRPVVCTNPAGCVSGGAGTARGLVPQGKTYLPPGTRPSPYVGASFMLFYEANNSYNGLDVTLTKRFSQGLTFRTNYTFSKSLDLNSTQSASSSTNSPATVYTRYNLRLSWGRSGYDITNKFNTNFTYELPFGAGKAFGSSAAGFWNQLISDWQWNGILTAQDGLPVTPLVGSNRSGTGDSRNPDVPNRNPAFSGPIVTGTPEQWFDPRAFLLPIAGTFGDAGKAVLVGPGLFNLDTSLFKKIPLSETWNLQFRFEAFNVLNRTNFSTPLAITFSGNNYNTTAGRITSTAKTSRELQFALRLTF